MGIQAFICNWRSLYLTCAPRIEIDSLHTAAVVVLLQGRGAFQEQKVTDQTEPHVLHHALTAPSTTLTVITTYTVNVFRGLRTVVQELRSLQLSLLSAWVYWKVSHCFLCFRHE